MASEKQLLANIENAKKSTGPRTEAGKKRSSLNALRHGLTGQVVILPREDIAAFAILCRGLPSSAIALTADAEFAEAVAGRRLTLDPATGRLHERSGWFSRLRRG